MTTTTNGSWEITFDGVDPNESDLQHVAEQIQAGFTSGELIQEDESEE